MRLLATMMLCGVLVGSCCDCPAPQGGDGEECFPNDTCEVGLSCVDGRCVAPSADCGNGICDPEESSQSCPEDCGGEGCGNGTIDVDAVPTEVCDGSNLGGETCATLGYGGGTLACETNCLALDETGCNNCGDLVIEIPEVCDASNLGGLTCADVGFLSGTLACSSDCLGHDTSGCANTCVEASCTECLASSCATNACEAELEACNANPDCLSLANCLETCVDIQCQTDCNNQFPLGAEDYLAALTCLVCDADVCLDECESEYQCP